MVASTQTVTVRKAAELIEVAAMAGLVCQMNASPGVGKSSIAKKFAKKHNLKMIDLRLSTCAPEDLNGLPHFDEQGRAVFKPFRLFPLAEDYPGDTPLPINPDTQKPYSGWLLFLDEFKSAPKSVIAAAYKLVLDRQVGLHDLHSRVVIMTASNLATDRAIVNDPGTAMQSRLLHLVMEVNAEEWLEDVAIAQQYDRRIISFISQYNSKLMDFDPKHQDLTFCCPRTWEFVNKVLKTYKGSLDNIVELLAGTITSLIAIEFVEYCRIFDKVISINEILTDPENVRIPDDLSLRWATLSVMGEHVSTKNFKKLYTYADRFDMPMRIMFYRQSIVRCPEIADTSDWGHAMDVMAQYLNSK